MILAYQVVRQLVLSQRAHLHTRSVDQHKFASFFVSTIINSGAFSGREKREVFPPILRRIFLNIMVGLSILYPKNNLFTPENIPSRGWVQHQDHIS